MWGKLLGLFLGWWLLGPFGAVAGLLLGHLYDSGSGGRSPWAAANAEVQETFFTTVFLLLGHLAKADGQVSEAEIRQTEGFMRQMGLRDAHRQRGIELFRQGRDAGFDPEAQLRSFNAVCGRYRNLRQMLLVYLIGLALADGELEAVEERLLRGIAQQLGFDSRAFDTLLRMILAQDQFRGFQGERAGRQGPARARQDELAAAYQALGVDASASDKEVKTAYRRLMRQYHPDKLVGQGMPEDMVQVATERAQEVQAAYDLIKRSREGAA